MLVDGADRLEGAPASNSGPRVLLIEEEAVTRKLVENALKSARYEVVSRSGDAEVFSLLQQSTYDALILGNLPAGINHFQLCKDVRNKYDDWLLPLIVLSDERALDDIDRCMDAGASDFIIKPFKEPLLLARLKQSINASRVSADLRLKESRLRRAQSMARIGYWHMKDDPSNVTFSDAFCNILDIPADSIKTFQELFEVVHPEDQERFMAEIQMAFIKRQSFNFSHRLLMSNGQEFFVSQIGEFISGDKENDGQKEFFVTMRDETEIFFTREKLRKEKYFDTVTGLPNRTQFLETLALMIEEARTEEKMLSCYFVGIDGYKALVNTLGAQGSDSLLLELAQRMQGSAKVQLISRYGSDVFAILSDTLETIPDAEKLATDILQAIRSPIKINGEEVDQIRASIGIAFYPLDANSVDGVIASVNTAMHDVKKDGGNAYAIHTDKMRREFNKLVFIEKELKWAIEHEDLELYYQPQITLSRSTLSGIEALVRWNHPDKGLIPPFEFIEIAEKNGLIIPMGEWILEQAAHDGVEFHNMGYPDLRIGINLSARQFDDKHFLQKVKNVIQQSGINPKTLELEVTESSAMSDLERAVRILRALRELGAHTSMDDFGTGFSSLGSLQLLPLNTLKIDRAFVKDIGIRENAGAIASAIIAMARGLGMSTIAEGVETEEQLAFMKKENCDVIQGFYYSKPLPKPDFIRYLKEHRGV